MIPVWHGTLAIPGARLAFVLVLAALLTSCGGARDEEVSNVPNTTAQSTEEASSTEPPSNVAEIAASAIDESLLRENLAYLTGASPAPLSTGEVTIVERGSEEGRRTTAQYIKESFEAMGIPARILEFSYNGKRGFNVEAVLQGTEGEKHLWLSAHLD